MTSFKNLLNSLKNKENSGLLESFTHAFETLFEASLPVDPEELSTQQLSKISKIMNKMGYDWRGPEDARELLNQSKNHPTEDMIKAVETSFPKTRGPQSVSEKATRHFGSTSNFSEAGWLNEKGTLLNLSDGQRGRRVKDHAEVGLFLGEEEGIDSPFKIKLEFMKLGNIRLHPEQPGFNLIKRPTKAQQSVLSRFIRNYSSEPITVEIWDEEGQSKFNKEYPPKTNPVVIGKDIIANTSGALTESIDTPEGFSLNELKKITSFAGRLKYIKSRLPRVGKGSSRAVYAIDNDKVLKLAMNKKGLDQNMTEVDVANLYDSVPKVFDFDENNHTWTITEKVTPIKDKSDFERVAGITFENFVAAVRYELDHRRDGRVKLAKPEFVDDYWNNNEVFSTIVDMAVNYDMPSGDLLVLGHYGIGADGKIKLIDAGLTNEVWRTHYKR